jgi:hypothetical protein
MYLAALFLLFDFAFSNTVYVDNTSTLTTTCSSAKPCKDMLSGFGALTATPAKIIIVNRGNIGNAFVCNSSFVI